MEEFKLGSFLLNEERNKGRKKERSFFCFQNGEGVFDVWLIMSMEEFKLGSFLLNEDRKKEREKERSFFCFRKGEGVFDVWLTMSMQEFKLGSFLLNEDRKKERKKRDRNAKNRTEIYNKLIPTFWHSLFMK